jgi:uncharacterized membrane protein YfcA
VPLEEELLLVIGGATGFEIAIRVAHHILSAGLKRLFAAAILVMSIVMFVCLLAG